MKPNVSSITSLVLVLVAFSSFLSMFALLRIDSILRQDLYKYGLQFSYEWAMPYWTMSTLVFAMGWFDIIVIGAFQFYVLIHARKDAEVIPQKEALKPEEAGHQPPIEEAPQEYIVTEQPQEVEVQREQEAEFVETVEAEREPEERFEERQEPVDMQLQEETSYVEEGEREQEEMSRETQETPQPAPEIEAETTEREET